MMEIIPADITNPSWAAAYYPEDLPDEWRLTYYANAFHSLFLPARLDGWLATQDPAEFETVYLQEALPSSAAPEADRIVVLAEGESLAVRDLLAGVVAWITDTGEEVVLGLKAERQPTLRELRSVIENIDETFPRRHQVIVADASPEWFEQGAFLLDLMGK